MFAFLSRSLAVKIVAIAAVLGLVAVGLSTLARTWMKELSDQQQ